MNFFQQLAATSNADITLRIMQKGDELTINVIPGSSKSTTKPIIITGTAAELDEDFFKTIMPGVQEIKGIISNIDDVKKEAEKELEDKKSKKSATPKKDDKPAAKPKPVKKSKNPVAVEASIFDEANNAPVENNDTEEDPEEVVSDEVEE